MTAYARSSAARKRPIWARNGREGTGGFRACPAALQTQRSTLSITSVCAGEEKGPFPHVAGELGRSLEFGAGLGQAAGPKQKVAPCRQQWRIIAQGGGVGNLVHQSQTRFRPEGHAVGHRPI